MILIPLILFQIKAYTVENNFTTSNCQHGSNCLECLESDIQYCTSCPKGYGLQINKDGKNTGRCERCKILGCDDCNSDSNYCQSYNNDDNMINIKANKAIYVPFCDKINTSEPGKCAQCKKGYGFVKDKGVNTGICGECLEHCQDCDFIDECKTCETGYGFKSNGSTIIKSKCVNCPDFCAKCTNDNVCTQCEKGFGPTAGTLSGKCRRCPDNCNDCSTGVATCKKCDAGFGKDESGKCTRCPDNCLMCSEDSSKCTQCQFGYNITKSGECRNCRENCDKCSSDITSCDKCSEGYGPKLNQYGIESGSCAACPEHCIDCSKDSAKCIECESGYGQIKDAGSQGKCGRCPSNCEDCETDSKTCKRCAVGSAFIYYEGKNTGLCAKCTDNCKMCYSNTTTNELRCQYCVDGYGLVFKNDEKISNTCLPCEDENCLECRSNYSVCTKCSEGFFLNDQKCEMCPEGCPTCTNATKCNECDEGYGFDAHGTCVACDEGCKKCINDGTYCTEVKEGYGFILGEDKNRTGAVMECPENCKICTDNAKMCSQCSPEFGQRIDQNGASMGECEKCSTNCYDCLFYEAEDREECIHCNKGFGFLPDSSGKITTKCGKCPENCDYCSKNSQICISCGEGKGSIHENGLPTEKCEFCSENCLNCALNSKVCSQCVEYTGFYEDEAAGEVKCLPCPSGCDNCTYSSHCDVCSEGYGLNEATGQCLECNEKCTGGCKDGNCIRCEEGYGFVMLDESTQTGECMKCGANCIACFYNYEECELCSDGYGLEIVDGKNTMQCVKCPEGCKFCDTTDSCKICDTGYAYVEDKKNKTVRCEKCSDHCSKCINSEKCIKCEENYYNPDGFCYECPENCKECHEKLGTCIKCMDGYSHEKLANGTVVNNSCVACPRNCKDCSSNNKECDLCMSGYGFKISNETNTTECFLCEDPNCDMCSFDIKECFICLENYTHETVIYSPYLGQCVTLNGTCEVENCSRCLYGSSTNCIQCERGFSLDRNFKCREEVLQKLVLPTPQPFYYTVRDGDHYLTRSTFTIVNPLEVFGLDSINDSQILVFKLMSDVIETVSLKIYKDKMAPIEFEITNPYPKITFKVDASTIDEFTIKQTAHKGEMIFDFVNAYPSIYDAQGKTTIKCEFSTPNKLCKINKIRPCKSDLFLKASSDVYFNELEFFKEGEGMFGNNTDNNTPHKFYIDTIKVNQKASAQIGQLTIQNKIIFGLGSSLALGDNLNMSNATLELPYDPSYIQLFTDKPFITGTLKDLPYKIVIKDAAANTLLADVSETMLIAESPQEFDCEAWTSIIENEASNPILNEFYCAEEDSFKTAGKVYRLYARKSIVGGGKKKSALSKKTIIIIGASVGGGVVLIAIIVVVVVLVLRKKRQGNVSENEYIDNGEDDEENPNYY